jgi:hypothetical protein
MVVVNANAPQHESLNGNGVDEKKHPSAPHNVPNGGDEKTWIFRNIRILFI